MSPASDSTLADLEQSNADLQRELAELRRTLDERTRERDEALQERDKALQRETAAAEVLGVINSSPGDLTPVFDAMLEKATSLSEASFGILWLCDGERLHAAALQGVPQPYAEVGRVPIEPRPNNPLGRMLRGERLIVS